MQPSRTRALHALHRTRCLSASLPLLCRPAYAPREDAKRLQSTAAAAQPARQRPSPAFNREDRPHVQPLKPYRAPAMDHSFVGMTGGQIFHEMMLRQGVKHICTLRCCFCCRQTH